MTMTAAGVRETEHACRQPLLSPRSVAVIGTMQRHGSAGYETVHALHDYGFRGRLYPVNGSGRPVHGCGIASFVSLGDQLEVSANDLIGHWHTDPRVRAVALCLESY